MGRLLPPTPGGSSRPGWRHGERQLQGAAAYWQSRPFAVARDRQLPGNSLGYVRAVSDQEVATRR